MKQVALLNVALSPEVLNRKKGREYSLCVVVFKMGHSSSLAFGLGLGVEFTPSALLLPGSLGLDWNYTIVSPGSGLLSLHNGVS